MKRALALLLLLCSTASADTDRVASTGFFAEGGLGAVNFLPTVRRSADMGPSLDLRFGRDLFSFLSLGVYVAASSHEASIPPPSEAQFFQLYRGGADARISGRLSRLGAFVEGGLGATMISSNVLQKVMITDPGEKFSILFHAGGGFEYQLENRHYGIGIAADAFLAPQFKEMKAIESRFYLRYTYGGG